MPADWSGLSEQELVELLRAGEEGAFDALLKRYQGKIYWLALSVTKNREDAEEVLQDVFLSVYQKIAKFDGRSAFGTWLYRITVNTALMKLRGRGPAQESFEEYLPQFSGGHHARMVRDWTEGAEELIFRKERAQVVRQAIEALPPEYRVVLVLRDLEGLSNGEVADILDTSVAAVKARLHRARLALRGILERYVTEAKSRR
jgi:RNA polymerase sigma-70 factor (ECF subfamily)